jgi:murein DD-endopeptidase MepM/ murein hydrolase activator NlpD
MRTRYATGYGTGIWPQLFNLTTASFTIRDSYIKPSGASAAGAAAAVDIGAEDVSPNATILSPKGNDPTLEAACAFQDIKGPPTITSPICRFRPKDVDMYGSRAPIPNNPRPNKIYVNPSNRVVEATARFTDYLGNLWVYLTQARDKQTLEISTPAFQPIWIREEELSEKTGENCATLPIATQYTMPQAADGIYSWTTPVFTIWPIAGIDMCAPLSGDIQSLGINGPGASYPRGTHNGIDIFVSGSNPNAIVRSMANGLVVGINDRRDIVNSHGIWGAELPGPTGYAVVVRYGHLFVLYGHMASIDDAIWVGATVQAGARIGTLGIYRPGSPVDRHLHLEIHSFGQTVDVEGIASGEYSMDYTGIIPVGGSAERLIPPFVYDAVQLLDNPLGYQAPPANSKDLFATAALTLISGSSPQRATAILWINANGGLCNLNYVTVVPEPQIRVIQEVAYASYSYRGFATFRDNTGQYPALLPPFVETIRP